ncbi:MAG TPA: T9SS type A sorting domain-containing protein [Flavisolibacter sp.]
MNRNLLLIGFVVLCSFNVSAQNGFEQASNIISMDSSTAKAGKNAVRIYPNPSYGKLSVSAVTSSTLHFYIFDLEGTLVFQAVLNNKDRKVIDNLKRGSYLYDVFENDESIEEGKIIIK